MELKGKIQSIVTPVDKNSYHLGCGNQLSMNGKICDYYLEQYKEHDKKVNTALEELYKINAENIRTKTREVIVHRHNNGSEDRWLIITEVYYES